jgi:hypothetical protein
MGYNRRKTVPVWDTVEESFYFVGYNRRNSSNFLKLFCGVSHAGGKPPLLFSTLKKSLPRHPTTEKKLFQYIPPQKKIKLK